MNAIDDQLEKQKRNHTKPQQNCKKAIPSNIIAWSSSNLLESKSLNGHLINNLALWLCANKTLVFAE